MPPSSRLCYIHIGWEVQLAQLHQIFEEVENLCQHILIHEAQPKTTRKYLN